MKRLIVLAAIGVLLLPDIAAAQRDDRRPDRPGRPDRPVTLPSPVPGAGPGNRPGPGRPDRPGQPNRPGPGMGPPPRPMPGVRPPPRPPQFSPRPPQFSWRGRSFSQYRASPFRYPPGYSYRRWSIGALLPNLLFGSSYFYDDWARIGIDRPPPGRRWVRYGSDLLLVNTRTRRVEDVIHNVFY